MMTIRKIRAAIALNKRKRVDQIVTERVQLKEFNGKMFIALDGIPVQRVYQGGRDIIETLNEAREAVRTYLQGEE